VKRIGVLALQGDFAEHIAILRRLDAVAFPVRLPSELQGVDGLIIPGGESTTMAKLMADFGLMAPLRKLCKQGLPVMGTCAGMVLLAKNVTDKSDANVKPLGVMDIDVKRNAFGRQVDSFETNIEVAAIGEPAFHSVFIRAPFIQRAGDGVIALAQLPDGTCVAARQGNMIALAFHPELTDDVRLHSYFLTLVNGGVKK
jgi:5'-phosphate synthase pdxT subunit